MNYSKINKNLYVRVNFKKMMEKTSSKIKHQVDNLSSLCATDSHKTVKKSSKKVSA